MHGERTPVLSPVEGVVFFDASVLVAASRSPSGGSAVAIEVCTGQRFRAAVTNLVLLEARHNIAAKFGREELLRFYRQLAAARTEIVPPPPPDLIDNCIPLTTEKDAHVLAAALHANASHLLTLDRRHLLTPATQSASLPLTIQTPGEFLQQIAIT